MRGAHWRLARLSAARRPGDVDDEDIEGTDGTDEMDDAGGTRRLGRNQRSRRRLVLAAGGGVLIAYYSLVVVAGMRDENSSVVPLGDAGISHPATRVTLEVEAATLEPSTGALDVLIRPVPRGLAADSVGGHPREPLQVLVASVGEAPMSFDFPAGQVIDPVAVSVDTSTGAHRFPFDRPEASFRLDALLGGEPVPVDVEMTDETEGWDMSGSVRPDVGGLRVDLAAGRELLPISFAIFYTGGIVMVGLITVAVIGTAIARGRVGFDQVIWLGAMLVAIPAVRNAMPGVPPVGTAVDLLVYLPSLAVVGMALLAAIVVLAINEAAANRSAAEGD